MTKHSELIPNKLSVIVPVFNEAPHLRAVLHRLLNSPCSISREWILIDDCSTDSTLSILEELARDLGSHHEIRVLDQPVHRGKGAAVIRGIEAARGEFLMIQDADSEYDPADVSSLLEPILNNRADVVYGSRFKNSSLVHRTFHRFVNRSLTLLSNLFSGIYLSDMETCYKVFRSDLPKSMNLVSERFGIEVELTAYLAKTQARIYEVAISYHPRTRLQGKKINWLDGVAALFHIIRFNWMTSLSDAFTHLPSRYWPEGYDTETQDLPKRFRRRAAKAPPKFPKSKKEERPS